MSGYLPNQYNWSAYIISKDLILICVPAPEEKEFDTEERKVINSFKDAKQRRILKKQLQNKEKKTIKKTIKNYTRRNVSPNNSQKITLMLFKY